MGILPGLTTEQWREDLQLFARELTHRHKNPYHFVAQEAFEQAVAALDVRLATLQDYEIIVGIQRLAAMIGDGHTFLNTWNLYHYLPFEVFWFGKELRVTHTIAAYQQTLGCRLVKIGAHRISEVQRRLQAIIPQGENKWFVLWQSAYYMMRVEPLVVLGVLPNRSSAPFTFEEDGGKRFDLPVVPMPPDTSVDWVDTAAQKPLYLQKPEETFWFTELPDSHTVYVNFRGYQDLEAHAEKLFAFVESQPVKRLVIDMRQNLGGDCTLGRSHLLYKIQRLPSVNRQGGLFVVIGRGTFSAAMTNATDFRRETDAILIGEPTGARPNGYQELTQFTLPNSQLQVFCSIRYYRFQDKNTPAVLPDQRIDLDWASYKAGRDPVMEWILAQPIPPTTSLHAR